MNPTENYRNSIAEIIRTITEEGPTGIPEHARASLLGRVTDPTPLFAIYANFERWNREAKCSLEVQLVPVDPQGFPDDQGNHWMQYRVEVDVTWPTYAGTGLVQAQARAATISEVVAFATNLAAAWHRTPIYLMQQTKAEFDKSRVQLDRDYALAQALVLVQRNSKGLRVNDDREVTGSVVPAGDWPVTINTRHYVVRSDGKGLANICRNA